MNSQEDGRRLEPGEWRLESGDWRLEIWNGEWRNGEGRMGTLDRRLHLNITLILD